MTATLENVRIDAAPLRSPLNVVVPQALTGQQLKRWLKRNRAKIDSLSQMDLFKRN